MMDNVTQHRTQIYLPKELYRQLKVLAQVKNISLAHVVRDAVSTYTASDKKRTRKTFLSAKKALLKRAGLGSGPRDLAKRHDAYW